MKYSEQVRKDAKAAADYIREHGWFQGNYTGPNGCVCAVGAVLEVVGGWASDRYDPLTKAIASSVGYIPKWNDDPKRTKEEVIEVFERIANS